MDDDQALPDVDMGSKGRLPDVLVQQRAWLDRTCGAIQPLDMGEYAYE
jgi:hypothetical protein